MKWDKARFNRGTRITPAEATALRQRYPQVPEDYVSFMEQVGWGEQVGINLYSGPSSLGALGLSEGPPNFLAVGDDMAGFFYGFDVEHDTVVGVDPSTGKIESQEVSFHELMLELSTEE